jgi:hypothetical protein
MEEERRRVPRFPFSAPAELVPEDTGSAVSTRVKELSLYGCYMELSTPLPRGAPVLVKIFSGADFFEARATVVYVDEHLGMGLAFRNVRAQYLVVLQKWLQATLQELAPPRV